MKAIIPLGAVLCFLLTDPAIADHSEAPASSRYPTSDEAFYVLACMERNGQDAVGLQKCSCAINAIEAQLPYEQYSEAVLVFAMRQAGGERSAIFRDATAMKGIAEQFIRAQREANQQCFGPDNTSTNAAPGGAATHLD